MSKLSFLVATDMSPRSDLAVRRAWRMAVQLNASITFVHVVDDAAPPDISSSLRDASLAALQRFAGSLPGSVETEFRVDFGDPTADILALTEELRPDLLVMGMHRDRSFLDALRETTAQRIARLCPCPVLMVRDRDDHDYDNILCATDFSPSATAAITLAATLSPKADITPVHVFHIPYSGMIARNTDSKASLEASFLKEAEAADAAWRGSNTLPDTCAPTRFLPGSVMQNLVEAIQSSGASLIAAGAHGKPGQARAMLGSVANDLLRTPPCDVLIARPKRAG